jgi:Acetyltransferase (GNAT) domain
MRVVPFTADHTDAWDRLVETAPMATFLHTRRFLSYHGDRFKDASVVLFDENGAARAVLPAALDPDNPARVISHPGATYGGLVHDGRLNGQRAREALAAICGHYAGLGIRALLYKPVPYIYHRSPSADDVWAIAELGARRMAGDLSCAIDLSGRRTPSQRRLRSLDRAQRNEVAVSDDPQSTPAFWAVLQSALERRYSARPVHTLDEIEELRSRFPDEITPVVAVHRGNVVAGTVLFKMPRVWHTQYLATSDEGMAVSALDVVIEHCIEKAVAAGTRYFDFGISPGAGRRGLNAGLYRFKAEFGGGGVVYEQYEHRLTTDDESP